MLRAVSPWELERIVVLGWIAASMATPAAWAQGAPSGANPVDPAAVEALKTMNAGFDGLRVIALAARSGGAAQRTQVNNNRADVRTNNVRNTSVNNVHVDRDVNVNVNVDNRGCCSHWDYDYHPVAAAAAVTATVAVTSAVIGSMVRTLPPACVPVNYRGMIYQQCGSTWYVPQGSQFVVVAAPY